MRNILYLSVGVAVGPLALCLSAAVLVALLLASPLLALLCVAHGFGKDLVV